MTSPITPNVPLVTAILVCWNHRCFVRQAVLSALEQTYPSIELIVIDNGSTDGSQDELLALRDEHDFTLLLQDNVGLVRALNQALGIAHGKYLACLATDDAWLPDKTSRQVALLEADPGVHLASGQVACIDAGGRPLDLPVVVRPGDASFSDLMTDGCFVYGPTIMCRVESLREMGGFDESLRIEDYSLALRLTNDGKRVVVMPDVLTLYRRHGNNWTAGSIDGDLSAIGQRYRHMPEYPAFYRRNFPFAFWQLVRDGRKLDAWRLLRDEPICWTWSNLGRGLLRMFVPFAAVSFYRALKGKPTPSFAKPEPPSHEQETRQRTSI